MHAFVQMLDDIAVLSFTTGLDPTAASPKLTRFLLRCSLIPPALLAHACLWLLDCLQVKAESVLDEAALRQLYYLLEEDAVAAGDALKINYDGFSQVGRSRRRTAFVKAMFLRLQAGNLCWCEYLVG